MKIQSIIKYLAMVFLLWPIAGCALLKEPLSVENKSVPPSYGKSIDSKNTAIVVWRDYFKDKNLIALIDTALRNNQELNITRQEIEILRNEIQARKGEYLPFGGVNANVGSDRSGKYTWNGQSEEDWKTAKNTPKYRGDFLLGFVANWELDVWKKLRNGKNAAVSRYLASEEGTNFMITNLVSEIANSYYELLALDNQLDIIIRTIGIQQNALNIVKQQKDAARLTQLAVNRFEAQLLNTMNLQYDVQQQVVEMENKINFLVGRFSSPILRSNANFYTTVFDSIFSGLPSQLLDNRPDIRRAEHELTAAKIDIKVAKAVFYPSVNLSANLGFQAFNPLVWLNPTSLLYNLSSDLIAPLINRNSMIANYKSSRSKQMQAILNYEKTILMAFYEVQNQLSGIDKFTTSFNTKNNEVNIFNESISISDNLFKSARADYGEVLLTQRDALDSKMELIEIKKKQINYEINAYKALGGGWR